MYSIYFLMVFLMTSVATAEPVSLGSISENITEPIEIVSGFVSVGCLIVGFSCFFAAIVKYCEYRRNPLAVPVSKVIWLIIIGILLLLLPFAYLITGEGIPLNTLWGGG
jgi:hypothetical protein